MQEPLKYFLQPGYLFVSKEHYHIHTVLGSCVSVCLWDSAKKFGGMNHFLYNTSSDKKRGCRYGDVSTKYLIQLMKEKGSRISDLRAHIVGGSQNKDMDSFKVGEENIDMANLIVRKYGIKVLSRDTGSSMGRKLIFDNNNGEIIVYKVGKVRKGDWY